LTVALRSPQAPITAVGWPAREPHEPLTCARCRG